MIYITDETVKRWTKEDAPYIDLTTELLGIGGGNIVKVTSVMVTIY